VTILLPGETHYDDSNCQQLIGDGEQIEAGGETRLLSLRPRVAPYGTLEYATRFSERLSLIDEAEWPERIRDLDRLQAWPIDHCTFPPYDQNGLPYCWVYAPCQAATICRLMQGLSLRIFAPESVGGPVTGYRKRGGWATEAVQFMSETGIAETDLWPRHGVSGRYRTAEVEADYPNNRVMECFDCPQESFAEAATGLLSGLVPLLGFNWWRHEVIGVQLVQLGRSAYGLRIRNTWGNWGGRNRHNVSGFSLLSGRKAIPSDVILLRQMRAS